MTTIARPAHRRAPSSGTKPSARPLVRAALPAAVLALVLTASLAGGIDAVLVGALFVAAGAVSWLRAVRTRVDVVGGELTRMGMLTRTTLAAGDVRAVRARDPETGPHTVIVVGRGLRSVAVDLTALGRDAHALHRFTTFVQGATAQGATIDAAARAQLRAAACGASPPASH